MYIFVSKTKNHTNQSQSKNRAKTEAKQENVLSTSIFIICWTRTRAKDTVKLKGTWKEEAKERRHKSDRGFIGLCMPYWMTKIDKFYFYFFGGGP